MLWGGWRRQRTVFNICQYKTSPSELQTPHSLFLFLFLFSFTLTDMAAEKEGLSHAHGDSQKAVIGFEAPEMKGRNKFAIACSILASMIAVLSGYGEFRWVLFRRLFSAKNKSIS